MSFSRKSIVRLSEALARQFGHQQFDALFFEFEVERLDPKGNLHSRALGLLRAIDQQLPPTDALAAIIEIANRLAPLYWQPDGPLVAAMRLDGYEYSDGRLVPSSAGAIELGETVTLLERDLGNRGLITAQIHYRQAVDNFADGNAEACNGQIRSFLEAFLQGVYLYSMGSEEQDPEVVLRRLRDAGKVDHGEFSLSKAFWNGIQSNGPHAGLSCEQEALYRLHVASAIAVYLLHKLPKTN